MTQRQQVIELLKTGWYSGFKMNLAIQSTGGAPRITELKTTNPHVGWKIIERRSLTDKCQEYMLIPDKSSEIHITNVVNGQTGLFDTRSLEVCA